MRIRPRRLRASPLLREALAETRVGAAQLIQPHFVLAAARGSAPIESMPGIERMGVEPLVERVGRDLEFGLALRNVGECIQLPTLRTDKRDVVRPARRAASRRPA